MASFIVGALAGAAAANHRRKKKARAYAYEQQLAYGAPYATTYTATSSPYYYNTGGYTTYGQPYYSSATTSTTTNTPIQYTSAGYPIATSADYLSRGGNVVYQTQAPSLVQPAPASSTLLPQQQYVESYVAPGHTVERRTVVSPPVVTRSVL